MFVKGLVFKYEFARRQGKDGTPLIGYRTMKTALGAAAAIFIASQFGLEFYVSTGIITILSIQVTRKQTVKASLVRSAACVLGLLFCFPFFELVGYHPVTIMLILLFFIPLLVWLKLNEGFVSASVVILHIFTLKQFTWSIFVNELAIIGIGVGVGLLMNLYMPKIDRELVSYQQAIEQNFAIIFKEYATYLRTNESDWDGSELIETEELLNQAKSLAIQDVENHLFRKEDRHYFYFEMREKQYELLERMLPIVSSLHHQVPQGEQIADFLEDLSNGIHPGNTAYLYLDKLKEMRQEIKKTPLPVTREEFEVRASLFYLLNEMEQYLIIKDRFGKEKT